MTNATASTVAFDTALWAFGLNLLHDLTPTPGFFLKGKSEGISLSHPQYEPCSSLVQSGLDPASPRQTAVVTNATASTVVFDTALWAFGLNLFGQLGRARNLATTLVRLNPQPY